MQNEIDIEKLRSGDRQTFKLFFECYYPKLMALACRYVNEHTAKDIVQDLFVIFWEKRTEIHAENLQAYLFRSVQNGCLNYLKHQLVKEDYETQVYLSQARMEFFFERTDANEVLSRMIHLNIHEIIERSLSKLPPKSREVFRMFFFDDKSQKQIASLLNISPRTVEKHISNAVAFLRQDLKNISF